MQVSNFSSKTKDKLRKYISSYFKPAVICQVDLTTRGVTDKWIFVQNHLEKGTELCGPDGLDVIRIAKIFLKEHPGAFNSVTRGNKVYAAMAKAELLVKEATAVDARQALIAQTASDATHGKGTSEPFETLAKKPRRGIVAIPVKRAPPPGQGCAPAVMPPA